MGRLMIEWLRAALWAVSAILCVGLLLLMAADELWGAVHVTWPTLARLGALIIVCGWLGKEPDHA